MREGARGMERLDEMCNFCDKYNVCSFYLLAKYAALHRPDWSRVLMKETSAIYMEEWLKSRQWSIDNDQLHIVDQETGELIL